MYQVAHEAQVLPAKPVLQAQVQPEGKVPEALPWLLQFAALVQGVAEHVG
jgi:Na+-transporting methylmalonyl-CoA/oxaloacetate decarboxylase gamma subunit